MNLLKPLIAALIIVVSLASAAGATVTISGTSTNTNPEIGDIVAITVSVEIDENLTFMFFSAKWDSAGPPR